MNGGGGRSTTVFEMCAPVYRAAALAHIDPLTVDACELWQVGAALGTFDIDGGPSLADDAEVFRARMAGEPVPQAPWAPAPNVVPFRMRPRGGEQP